MESESLDRRLAAILSADAVAYSWLMARDEETTVATLKRHRNAMMSLVRQHRGRVVDDLADGLLAEFPSAIDAVACAVQTQRDVEARNLEYADTPAMRFRIGVHVGEVLVDGDRLFGDAVNISARVRENADEGGVMLSGTARFHIEGRLDVTIEDLGSVSLKHIPTPVEICRVVLGEVPRENDGRHATGRSLPVPGFSGRPAIAVLPFQNLSGDAAQDAFADSISEDLIHRISARRFFPVVARNSSFTYKGQSADPRQIGADLGVRYVVDGSVRRSNDRVRISVELVDATTGLQAWSGRYDRELGEVFALQDEITATICGAIEPELQRIELRRSERRDPRSLDAWECVQRGIWHYNTRRQEDVGAARQLFERAAELDPSFAPPWAYLALTGTIEVANGWTGSPGRVLHQSAKWATRALELDPLDPYAHHASGMSAMMQGRHEQAAAAQSRAIEIDPSFALGYFGLGAVFAIRGPADEAMAMLEKAIRLSPRDPVMPSFLWNLANAHFMAEQYEDAVRYAEEALPDRASNFVLRSVYAAALAHAGREEKARLQVATLVEMAPTISADGVRRFMEYMSIEPGFVSRVLSGLRTGGLV